MDKLVEEMARAIDPYAFSDPTGDSYAEKRLSKAFERAQACAAIAQKRVNELETALVVAEEYVAAAAYENRGTDDNAETRRDLEKVRAALPTMLKGNGDG